MALVTMNQTLALEHSARLMADSATRGESRKVRTYVVEVPPNGLGQTFEYWVDRLPYGENEMVRCYDMIEKPVNPNHRGLVTNRYATEEVPL